MAVNVGQRHAVAVQPNSHLGWQTAFQYDTWQAALADVVAGLAPQGGQAPADGGQLGCGASCHRLACEGNQRGGGEVEAIYRTYH